jgi:glycerol-3-phosphate cytidylyltransferase-like family protein
MFQSKLLKILLAPFMMHIGEETGGGGAADAGGFDMAGAVDSISEGLGFGTETSDDNSDPDLGLGGDGAADAGTSGDVPSGEVGDKGSKADAPNTSAATTPPGQSPDAQKPADGTGQAVMAPRTWRPEAAAEWEKLPEAVKAEVAKREEDMFRGLETYKQDAGVGKAFVDAIRPHLATLKQVGADPFALAGEFMNAHLTFATGTQAQKQELLQKVIQDYGIDTSVFQDPDFAPALDPQVKALRDELAAVKSQLSGHQSETRQMQERQRVEILSKFQAEVDAFAANAANIYYKEVEHLIPQIISSGLAKDLQSAYDHAIMANPVTRDKEVARRTTEAATKAAAEAKAKAEAAARAAGANVKLKPKSASAATPLGSIDDTLNEAYAKLSGV